MISNSYLLIIKLDCLFIVCSLFTKNFTGRAGGGTGGGRSSDVDWTIPTARDERLELELFGNANTGINFNKVLNKFIYNKNYFIHCVIDSDRFVNLIMAYA